MTPSEMRNNKMKLVSLFLATLHLISAQEVTDNATPSVNYFHNAGGLDVITVPEVSLHWNNETTGDVEYLKYITSNGTNIKTNGDNITEFIDKSGKSVLHSGIHFGTDLTSTSDEYVTLIPYEFVETEVAITTDSETESDVRENLDNETLSYISTDEAEGNLEVPIVNAALYNESKLPSVFDLSNYINRNCSGNVNKTLSRCNSTELATCEKCEKSVRQSAIELCHDFQGVVVKVMDFPCDLRPKAAEAAIMVCKEYIDRCESFLANVSYTLAEFASDEYVKSNATISHLMEAVEMSNTIETSFMILFTQIQKIRNFQLNIGPINRTFVYESIVKEDKKLISQLEAYIPKLHKLLDHMEKYQQQDIFMTMYFSPRLDMPKMEYLLTAYRENLNLNENNVEQWRSVDVIRIQVKLAVFLLVFIVGSLGNILLLVIFIKHEDMRTAANLMLINLTVVDCLSLFFNIPIAYMKTTSMWTLGLGVCRFFYFVRNIVISVSTYSVVMISVQRFLAVTQFPTAQSCRMGIKTKSVLMLATVWFLGTLYSLPNVFLVHVDGGMCAGLDDDLFRFNVILDLVYICILPSILLLVFSLMTASRIKRSVSNVPGERAGQAQLRQDRMLSAHVLTALSVLFIISYFPVNVFYFIKFYFDIEMDFKDMYIVDVTTYMLMFTSTCLNPVALCIMSRKYRKYFREFLSCWNISTKIRATTSATDASVSTTESAI